MKCSDIKPGVRFIWRKSKTMIPREVWRVRGEWVDVFYYKKDGGINGWSIPMKGLLNNPFVSIYEGSEQ